MYLVFDIRDYDLNPLASFSTEEKARQYVSAEPECYKIIKVPFNPPPLETATYYAITYFNIQGKVTWEVKTPTLVVLEYNEFCYKFRFGHRVCSKDLVKAIRDLRGCVPAGTQIPDAVMQGQSQIEEK